MVLIYFHRQKSLFNLKRFLEEIKRRSPDLAKCLLSESGLSRSENKNWGNLFHEITEILLKWRKYFLSNDRNTFEVEEIFFIKWQKYFWKWRKYFFEMTEILLNVEVIFFMKWQKYFWKWRKYFVNQAGKPGPPGWRLFHSVLSTRVKYWEIGSEKYRQQ